MKTETQCNRAEQPWQMLRVQQNIGTNRDKGRDAGDTKPRASEEQENPVTHLWNTREGGKARRRAFCDWSINCESRPETWRGGAASAMVSRRDHHELTNVQWSNPMDATTAPSVFAQAVSRKCVWIKEILSQVTMLTPLPRSERVGKSTKGKSRKLNANYI